VGAPEVTLPLPPPLLLPEEPPGDDW